MHPSGVQFGLSRGLLQLRGEEVLLSDQLLEAISLEAQLHLHLGRPPIQGNVLVDITVRAAQNALGNDQGARRQEIVPFDAGLNRTMYYTLCRVAERAGLAHKEPRRLITNPEFWAEFCARVAVQGDAKSKLIWFSQQHADLIARFDPATRTFTEFPLANAEEDHRRIEIDPTNSNRIWWTGNVSGRIGYVELLK